MPDGIPGWALKECAYELVDIFPNIFNLSPLQSVVPTCLKKSTIVSSPKKTKPLCLNDYHSVAPTSPMMKCFEQLVKAHITFSLPDSQDPWLCSHMKLKRHCCWWHHCHWPYLKWVGQQRGGGSPDTVVSRQQPPHQYQKVKGDDCRLQEAADNTYQWDYSREGDQQVPESPHQWGPDLVTSHSHECQGGNATAPLPPQTEEVQYAPVVIDCSY